MHTLPETHPLNKSIAGICKSRRQYCSPFYPVAETLKATPIERIETIKPFTLAPWESRIKTIIDQPADEQTETSRQAETSWPGETDYAVRIAVGSSARNGVVGIGRAIETKLTARSAPQVRTMSSTLGLRSEHNPHSGELVAAASALKPILGIKYRSVALMTRNKAIALTLARPHQQSGQQHIRHIYDAIKTLRRNGNSLTIMWIRTGEENELLNCAKEMAKAASRPSAAPQKAIPQVRSTTLNEARCKRGIAKSLPAKVGKYSKKIDTALPGKHTRQLYDHLSWKEASVLAQLRTGMVKLNAYLHQIKAEASDQCACGRARETIAHFLFRCTRWTEHRAGLLRCTETRRSNLSFYLGGKSPADTEKWTPNMEAVRATIRFAMATGRLDAAPPRSETNT